MSRRKIKLIIILIVSLIGISTILFVHPYGKRYSESFISREDYNKIISNRKESENNLLTSIEFNELPLFYDALENRWFYSVVDGDIDARNPLITYANKEIKLSFIETEINEDLIRNNIGIEAIAYNDYEYKEYKIVCTTNPLISIETQEKIGDDKVDMHIKVIDNELLAAQRLTEMDGKIRLRGASTKFYPKKNYRFELTYESLGNNTRKSETSLLGLRKDDDYTLTANYNEYEKIRNVFSMNLWYYACAENNSFGITAGCEYKYCEVLLNNEYIGLYSISYPIDSKQLQLSDSEYAYKKQTWDDERECNLNDIGPIPGYELVDESKYNNQTEEEKWEKLRNYYKLFFNNTENEDVINSIVDIDNAIDILIFYNFIKAADNFGYNMKNTFVVIKNDGLNQKTLFVPWDLDYSWGDMWINDITNLFRDHYSNNEFLKHPTAFYLNPINYIMDNEEILYLIYTRYHHLRSTDWSDKSINNMINKYENNIFMSGAYLREQSRWPKGLYDNTISDLSKFREYVIDATHTLDRIFIEQ